LERLGPDHRDPNDSNHGQDRQDGFAALGKTAAWTEDQLMKQAISLKNPSRRVMSYIAI
jgi:hypothetical protein